METLYDTTTPKAVKRVFNFVIICFGCIYPASRNWTSDQLISIIEVLNPTTTVNRSTNWAIAGIVMRHTDFYPGLSLYTRLYPMLLGLLIFKKFFKGLKSCCSLTIIQVLGKNTCIIRITDGGQPPLYPHLLKRPSDVVWVTHKIPPSLWIHIPLLPTRGHRS